MNAYSIQDIAKVLNGVLIKNSGGKINYLLIDSRKIVFPRESLFFALPGSQNHGSAYIGECYKAGVRNFVVENFPENMPDFPKANFVKVSHTFQALQQLVAWHRGHFKIPVIGVTGSNGKTIVKEWLYQCLNTDKYIIRNPKSYNSQVGVPLSVWLLNADAEMGIFEAGISMPHEMTNLEKVIQPTLGVFTNLGDAHQENFRSLDEKLNEKLKLFVHCETIIYPANNEHVEQIVSRKFSDKQLFGWGSNARARLRITSQKIHNGQTTINASFNDKEISVNIPFIDKASIENAMHVWSVLLLLKTDQRVIQQRLKQLEPVAMRLELKEGLNNCTIINDSYNSDLESLHIALDFLSYQNQHEQKVLVLSDIAQSGYPKKELYGLVADAVKQKNIDRLIGIGTDIQTYSELFTIRKDFFNTTKKLLAHLKQLKLKNATILLKGARKFQFESVSKQLQKQTHRTVFEIDLNALEYNLNYFKKQLNPGTGIIAMLKASSYGSGTFEIANICQYHRVAAIAVAFTDEGVELRKSGIKIPLIVMNPEETEYPAIVQYNLEPEIYDFNALRSFHRFLEKENMSGYPIHLKLDTGMNRSGFLPEETDALCTEISTLRHVQIKTVFSHLAAADEPQHDDFTRLQLALFEKSTQKIQNHINYRFEKHILNSAGTERFAAYQFNRVRLGIGLFGVSAAGADLAQVGSLTTSVVQVKKVKKGDTVGYGRAGVANTDMEIATLPIGYADGYRRILSNGVGKVWINGHLAPTIGNICMDITMINVTGLNVKAGDKVELFGKNLPVTLLANWMKTIPYEVLTGISKRVKRTYQYE